MANRRKRTKFFLARLFIRLNSHHAFEAAAAIAFWFFLSIVPLLVLLGFLVARVARNRGVDALINPMLDVMPDTAESIVRTELERMSRGGASLAPVGLLGYFWTASSGLHNLMDVFETAARVRRRPWWKKRAIALGWVVAGLATACVLALSLVRLDSAIHRLDLPTTKVVATSPTSPSAPATPVASSAPLLSASPLSIRSNAIARTQGAIKRRVHAALHTPVEEATASGLMLIVGLAFLAGFYRFAVDHPPGVARRIWPGSITAVASWLVVSWAFGLYVVSMSSYALYYGSLTAVAVMLVWLYLTSLSLVVGTEVNALLERRDA